jgi:endonuclease YncB( thermonuclease family)
MMPAAFAAGGLVMRHRSALSCWLGWVLAIVLAAPITRVVADGVVGTKRSKVYHTHPDDCSAAKNINEDNIVRFGSEEEARKGGRRLCKSCVKLDERLKRKSADKPEAKRQTKTKSPNDDDADQSNGEEAPALTAIDARVKKVLTGGTLLLENGDKVRLFGIVAPQAGQALADEAVRFIEKQTKGRKIKLVAEKQTRRDQLGRMIMCMSLGSGDNDLGGALIAEGLAAVDRSIESDQLDDYLKREDDAAWAGRGIWKKLDGPEGAAKVVTGKHTHEYHAADCPHVVHLIDPATISVNEAKGRRLYPCEYFHAENSNDAKEGD